MSQRLGVFSFPTRARTRFHGERTRGPRRSHGAAAATPWPIPSKPPSIYGPDVPDETANGRFERWRIRDTHRSAVRRAVYALERRGEVSCEILDWGIRFGSLLVRPVRFRKVGDHYVAHAPGDAFGLDGRAVRVWSVSPDGAVEVVPEEAWPSGEGCPVGVTWYIDPDQVADTLPI